MKRYTIGVRARDITILYGRSAKTGYDVFIKPPDVPNNLKLLINFPF